MLVFFFILGAILGSYANALIFRFGNEKPIVKDKRSYCDHCDRVLSWYELIPIVSYVWLLGKCRTCKRRIALHNVLVEIAMGSGFLFAAWTVGFRMAELPFAPSFVLEFLVSAVAVFAFVFFFTIDVLYLIIPDQISLPLIVFALALNTAVAPVQWPDFAIAGILGASFFGLQYAISKGKWVGAGDVRLGALLGVLLGIRGLAVALVIAYLVGMVFAVVLLAVKKATMKTAIPFGVFLMTGGFVSFFFGASIVNWYFHDLPKVFSSIFF